MNLKAICYSSVKNNQVLFKYDYMFRSKNIHHQVNVRKKFKIRLNVELLCSLYGIPYDLEWWLQCSICKTFIMQNLYKTT